VLEKRRHKVEEKDSQQKSKDEVPNFGVSKISHCIGDCTDIDKTSKSVVNFKMVQEWFIMAMVRNNITWVPPKLANNMSDERAMKSWWNAKDIKCVSELIKLYEGEQIKKAIDWLCNNWQTMKDKSEGRLSGSPTIGYLYSCRERIFSDAREGILVTVPLKRGRKKKIHMVGEYDAESANKSPRSGW